MKALSALQLVVLILLSPLVNADLSSKPESMDMYGHQVEGAMTVDGRLVAFVVEPDKEITYRYETAPGSGEWSKKHSLDAYGNWIMPGRHADGRISVFIIGTMGNVLSRVTQVAPDSDDWMKEKEFKGSYGQYIQPVSYTDGRLALFFLDMGREISVIEETAPNSGEFKKHRNLDLNGNRFEVGYNAEGELEMAIIGTMANVLTHAKLGADGEWYEKDIKGAYAIDISMQNSLDGSLHLFFIDPQKEISRVNLSESSAKVHTMDLYGNNIETVRGADGTIEIVIIGTMGNVLGHANQVSSDVFEWSKEKSIKGYANWLSAVERAGDPALFVVAPFASEVHVY